MYQDRQLFIENLCKFMDSCKCRLDNVLEEFGWSSTSVYSDSQNEPHASSNAESDDHLGSSSREKNDSLYNSSKKIDVNEGHFTYNIGNLVHLVTVGSKPLYKEMVESFCKPTKATKDEKSKTEALIELLKMERDAKRRRINYKNRVHTKNKSHIEIMREVLAEQMSTLSEQSVDNNSYSVKEEELGKIKPSEELIEIKFPNGNPYLAWKSVLEISNPDEQEKEYKSYCDRRQEFKKGRNPNYNDSEFSSPMRHDEISSKSKYSSSRSDYRKSHFMDSSSSHEEGGSKYTSHKDRRRSNKDISPDFSGKKDRDKYYKNGGSKYSDNEKYKRKHRDDRGSSPDSTHNKDNDTFCKGVSKFSGNEKYKHKQRYDTDHSPDYSHKRGNDKYYKEDHKHSESGKHKRKHRDIRDHSPDSIWKRGDNKYKEDEPKYSDDRRHKRNHSYSKSPSKHVSKKHKSKHKNNL